MRKTITCRDGKVLNETTRRCNKIKVVKAARKKKGANRIFYKVFVTEYDEVHDSENLNNNELQQIEYAFKNATGVNIDFDIPDDDMMIYRFR